MMMIEKWLPVVGYEGSYEVSDWGRVRSFKRKNPRIIVGKTEARGYRHVLLYRDGERRTVLVHSMVLAAFVGPRPDGLVACHWDGNPRNNNADNLRWDTQSANCEDARRHGTMAGAPKGAAHHNARLTVDDVRCIKAEPYFKGVNQMLGRAFGLSPGYVREIRIGVNWGHV